MIITAYSEEAFKPELSSSLSQGISLEAEGIDAQGFANGESEAIDGGDVAVGDGVG